MSYYTVFQTSGAPAAGWYETTFTQLYNRLIRRKGDPEAAILLLGTENNALQAEKELFDLAGWIKSHTTLAPRIQWVPARELAAAYHAGCLYEYGTAGEDDLPNAWEELGSRLNQYNKRYGHMLYDFDFAKPVPCEDVTPLFDALKAYLSGQGSDPYARQLAAIERREALRARIRARLDPLRRKWFEKGLEKALHFAPIREDSIAYMGLSYPLLRRVFHELGHRLVHGGAIETTADLYWLEASELEMAVDLLEGGQTLPDFSARIPARRARAETLRREIPPVFLPRTSIIARLIPWREDNQVKDGILKGTGTSAGIVTGTARVMFGPEDFSRMRVGDILVASTTTPAWTALFALAAGVVTDIGGPLSHSSIIAREYGIPAVMATGVATRRIKDGQTITVNGAAGTVRLNEGPQ